MSERGTPRASYTAGFKLQVVGYAAEHGNRAAGKKFAVDESCVRRWRVQREKLTNTPKLKHANRRGAVLFPDLETELACWIKEKRQGGFGVSTNVIRLKAKLSRRSLDYQKENLELQNLGVTASWNDMGFQLDAALQLRRSFLKTTDTN